MSSHDKNFPADTPRTNKVAKWQEHVTVDDYNGMVDFARQLERELVDALPACDDMLGCHYQETDRCAKAGKCLASATSHVDDAQPVAWRYRYKPSRAGAKYGEWKFTDTFADVNQSGNYEFEPLYVHRSAIRPIDVNWLSNVIRTANGDHLNPIGAGALAEKIIEAIASSDSR